MHPATCILILIIHFVMKFRSSLLLFPLRELSQLKQRVWDQVKGSKQAVYPSFHSNCSLPSRQWLALNVTDCSFKEASFPFPKSNSCFLFVLKTWTATLLALCAAKPPANVLLMVLFEPILNPLMALKMVSVDYGKHEPASLPQEP